MLIIISSGNDRLMKRFVIHFRIYFLFGSVIVCINYVSAFDKILNFVMEPLFLLFHFYIFLYSKDT